MIAIWIVPVDQKTQKNSNINIITMGKNIGNSTAIFKNIQTIYLVDTNK